MGRTYFEYNNPEPRNLQRSPYRNMPSSCIYCAYRNKPSESMSTTCSGCRNKYESKKSNNTF